VGFVDPVFHEQGQDELPGSEVRLAHQASEGGCPPETPRSFFRIGNDRFLQIPGISRAADSAAFLLQKVPRL
jgi:hypothetical protein